MHKCTGSIWRRFNGGERPPEARRLVLPHHQPRESGAFLITGPQQRRVVQADSHSMLRYALTMRAKNLSLVAGLLLIFSTLAAQQAATTPVVIRVTDPSGAGVLHIPVRVIPSSDAATKMETDGKGQLALDLKPGGYAVFARAAGFKPGVAHIDVTPIDAQVAKPPQAF